MLTTVCPCNRQGSNKINKHKHNDGELQKYLKDKLVAIFLFQAKRENSS